MFPTPFDRPVEESWDYGISVAEMTELPELAGTTCVAGAAGLGRRIERLNVMEVPDIAPWVRERELLLTTGYPLRGRPEALVDLVAELDERGAAGLVVKLGRYLESLPAAVLAEADRRAFPVLTLPDLGFDEVLTVVLSEVLDRQSVLLARSERLHHELLQRIVAGEGLAEVADHVSRLVRARILVTTADGRVLVETDRSTEDEAAGAATGPDAFDDGLERDPTGRVRVEDLSYGFSDGGGRQRIVVPVVAGRHDHGRMVATATVHPLSRSDEHALQRAATVVALSITKQRELAAVESKYEGDFLRDVLAGTAGPHDEVVAHAGMLGWDFDRPMVVVVAQHDEPAPPYRPGDGLQPPQDRFSAAWRSVVRTHDPGAAVVSLSDEVVAVVGLDPSRAGEVEAFVRPFVTRVSGDGGGGRRTFCTGLSRVFSDVDGLPAAYEQARSAVRVGRWLQGPGALAHFDSLGVHRLLSLVSDPAELTGFVRDTLGELAGGGAENEDLRTTLQALLDHNLNVAETARHLLFHYNTLRYRISKLERMIGPFTTDAHLRLNVAVALQALQLRAATGREPGGEPGREGGRDGAAVGEHQRSSR
ncbi:PucR family transcriptional regulator ligand-binding domain-containing protein [Nocardioides sp. ChNu-153]|uniref:PucR family transcriptional regulator n=1 Tax=unclassified Nocardioides TaxID=2615069 RepID=UPI00240586F2|nr:MULTISPECIES: PucR family transcriptional regulator [unclassified Nocardioides]MDF9714628.1 PucR family transcriptional regulator ligand-binding domain-containing protein [Nocardioides sp. ChNu-99]MDN7119838.1 PucR family transcriptional regulator ligand-binding domain-containing protein [Nocardioides sp. ChNu-153]